MREFEGSSTKRLVGHSGPVYGVKFISPDGQRLLVSVSQDSTIRIWSLDIFACVSAYKGHVGPIWDIDTAPLGSGPYFVTGGADRTARLWSTEQNQAIRIFAGHLSDVDCVRFHPNGTLVITGSSDRTVRVWDIYTGNCVRIFSGHTRSISSLVCSPEGRFVFSGDQGGFVKVWDLADGKLVRTLFAKNVPRKDSTISIGHSSGVLSQSIDWDGRILAVSHMDGNIRLWDVSKATLPMTSTQSEDCTLIASYVTKSTPVQQVQFTYRNLLVGLGPFNATNRSS